MLRTIANRRGQALVMLILATTFILSLAALSVDLVLAYVVKQTLATAIDSVALAGMRGLEQGASYEDQETAVNRIVTRTLNSNFPEKLLQSSNVRFAVAPQIFGPDIPASAPPMFQQDPSLQSGVRELRVVGEATISTTFAKVFGVSELKVRSAAIGSRRDVNVMLVLDRSGSLAAANAWDDVQNAAKTFLGFFDNNGDRLGLVSFGSGANVDVPLGSGFKDGEFAANEITKMDSSGGTNSAMGLWLAYAELLRINDPAAFNVIVFFTDGQPTAIPANWGVHTTGFERLFDPSNPSCSVSPKQAVIQTFTNATDMFGFNKLIAGPPKVNAASGWAADFEPVDGCEDLEKPYGQNVELLLNPLSCLPTTWVAPYDSSMGCANCALGEAYSKTFRIVPGPYGGYIPCDPIMFNTAASSYRGQRWMESARNLTTDVASSAGEDPSISGVTIFAIGLGVAGLTANEDFLLRVANDKDTAAYTTARPEGEYVFAPTAGDLKEAFDKVRSHVIRLTR